MCVLRPSYDPGERWLPSEFVLPASWRGKPVQIIADDHSRAPNGWIAFSEPIKPLGEIWGANEAAGLLWRTALGAALIFLPCFGICGFAIQKRVRDFTLIGAIALCATAASGYAFFWIWFFWPLAGRVSSLCAPMAFLIWLLWLLRRMDSDGRKLLRALFYSVTLLTAAALLVLSVGFLFGGVAAPMQLAAHRFSDPLPGDNWLPYLFAEGIAHGRIPRPLSDIWLSSDRPPLQTGMFLSAFGYMQGQESYTVISVMLQSLWIPALEIFLDCFGTARRVIRLVVVVCFFSGFTFLNSFYVWPKLLAASFIVPALGFLLSQKGRSQLHNNPSVASLVGALLAFGLLAHGGSAFAIAGIAATLLVLRKSLKTASFLRMGLCALSLYAPWILYQKFYDPPGDQLLKLHLAGVTAVDRRPLIQDVIAAYRKLDWQQVLLNKYTNIRTVLGLGYWREYWRDLLLLVRDAHDTATNSPASIYGAALQLRTLLFFFFVPNLGFLAVGIPALLVGVSKRRDFVEWRSASSIWVYIALTVLIWCLLMFSPVSTVLHQGTYVIVLLGYAGSILALWAVSPWIAGLFGALQVSLNVVLYVFTTRLAAAGEVLPEGSLRYCTLMLCAISCAAMLFTLYRAENGVGDRVAALPIE